MSLLTAIDSALSGLNGEATALGNISNNVANSSTVGFKETDTEFESMVLANSATGAATAAGSTAVTTNDISTAGQIQTTGVSTDIAVNGQGFIIVNTNANAADGSYLVTRAGSFRPDASGNLVNAAGLYLQGQPLDADGNVIGAPADNVSALSTVNISNLSVDSAPTTAMTFTANLPSADTAYSATTPAPSSTSVNYFDALGGTQNLQFQFTPTQPANAGDPASNEWTLNVFDSASSTPTTPVGTATLDFESSGSDAGEIQSVNATAGTYDPVAGTLTVTTASGQAIPITIGSPDASGGITQLAGAYSTSNIQQNGEGYGLLQGVNVNSTGQVVASFTNGATRPIYQLDLAMFQNPDGLTPESGDAFSMAPQAGVAQLFNPGSGPAGTTEGGSLEGSNVDLSTQLTNLIETQRAYSSTATVIQTATQMLDVVNHLNQ